MGAKLPESRETRRLGDMQVNQSAVTVPWAMFVDGERECWLNLEMPIADREGGTACMIVSNTPIGWALDVSKCGGYTWLPSAAPLQSGSGRLVRVEHVEGW